MLNKSQLKFRKPRGQTPSIKEVIIQHLKGRGIALSSTLHFINSTFNKHV